MKIVLQLTGSDGTSEIVTIEAGSNFTVPAGVAVEIVSFEGIDDMRVEGGELVLAGPEGTIRIAGLGADFLAETASIVNNGIDGPLPDGFLQFFGWNQDSDTANGNDPLSFDGQGHLAARNQAGSDLPPPLDSSNDADPTPAPDAPSILAWSDDTGVAGDGITADSTIVLEGTAEAGSTVTIFDGETELGTTTADADGNWSFAIGALADGAHTFTATASNAGGTGPASSETAVTVDTVAPDAPVIATYADDTGAEADAITADTTLTLTGTAEAGATVTLFDGAVELGAVVADGDGNWSFDTGLLADGDHDFTAMATDAAGNESALSAVYPVTVDTAAPAAPVIVSFADDTANGSDNVTSDNTLTLTGTAEVGATVTLFDGATELGTATVDGDGNWSFDTRTLDDGDHEFTATAADAAGNESPASAVYLVTVDTDAPDAPVIVSFADDTANGSDNVTSDDTLTLSGTAEAGATVTLFNGVTELGTAIADGDGNWSFDTGPLADDDYEFTATATDAAGNESPASAVYSVTVDTAAPDAPVISAYSDDTGTAADGITSDTTLTLTGTAEAGAVVTLFDGAAELGTATADGDGNWSFDTGLLSNGDHEFTATATDAAGNESPASSVYPVTVDTDAPDAPVIVSFSDDTANGNDNVTSDDTLTFTGTAEAGATVNIYLGGGIVASAVADSGGNWAATTSSLTDDTHYFTARAVDAAGNESDASAPMAVVVDTVSPAIAIATPVSGNGMVNAAEADDLSISGTAAGGQRVFVTLRDGSGATVTDTAFVDGAGNWTASHIDISDLDEGTITVEAYAQDQAGNVSGTATASFTHDSLAPAAPVIVSYSEDTGTPNDNRTSDDTVTLTGTAEAGTTVEVFDGLTSLGTVTTDGAGTWSFTTEALEDGAHSFTARASDAAGNASNLSAERAITVDTEAPGITLATPVSGDGFINASEDGALVLSGTASGGQRVFITITDSLGATVEGVALVLGGNWTSSGIDVTGLESGPLTVEVQAIDQAGNLSGTISETVTLDAAAPAAPVIAGFSDDTGNLGDNRTNDTTPTLTGTAEANTTVEIRDGAVLLGTADVDGDGNWSFTTGELSEGGHSLTARAVDEAGNRGPTASLSLTIDTTAPGITLTTPIATDGVVSAAEDNSLSLSGTAVGGQRVFVTVTDSLGTSVEGIAIVTGGGSWTLSGLDVSGLQNGGLTVEVQSIDQAGNLSGTVSANITLDNAAPAAPVITGFSNDTGTPGDQQTSDNTLTFTGTAEANTTVNVYLAGSIVATSFADGDGNWTATTGVLSDGYSSFTARASDDAGNRSGSSDPYIVIIDMEAPGAPTLDGYSLDTSTQGDGVTSDSDLRLSGTAPAGVSRIVIYDNGIEIGTATPSGGNWTFQTGDLDDGDHSFTAAARDQAGNESAETAALDVTIDTAAPDAPVITGFGEDTGTVGDGVTADTTLTITGTAEADATVSVFNRGSFLGTTTADGDGNWSFDTGDIGQAAHSFTARAADAAGNVSSMSGALEVTVTIPTTPQPVITGFSDDTGTEGDFRTNDTTLTLTGTSVADATVEIFLGGSSLGTVTADGDGNWSFATGELDEGAHSFTARATAAWSGQSAASFPVTVTVDTTAPTLTIAGPVDGDDLVGASGAANITVSGTANEGQLVSVTFRDNLGATVTGSAAIDGAGNWTLSSTNISALQQGTITVEARTTDAAGNASLVATREIELDKTAPAAPVITGWSDDTGAADGSTSDTTLTFTGTAEANATVRLYRGGGLVATVTADGDGNWTATTGELGEGYAFYEARATDAAGNTGAWSGSVAVNIDTTAPGMPAITGFSNDSGTVGDGLTNDNTLTLTGTGTIASTVVIYEGGVEIGTAYVGGSGTWTFTTAPLANGDHSFTAAARDGAGNMSGESAALDVTVDAAAPAIPVITGFSEDTGNADNQTRDNTLTFTGTAEANATVNIYVGVTVVATGVADGDGNWSASTGTMPDGWTYFYARAVDAAGNQSGATSNLTINIDTTPPGAPAITGYTNDNGAAADDGISSYNWTQLSGTAAAGTTRVAVYNNGVEVGTAIVSGGAWTLLVSSLSQGTHEFTAVGLDYVGNASGESDPVEFTVDLTAPAVPAITGISDDTGTQGDYRTSDTTPTLSGTAEANATVTIRDGATVLGTALADGDGNWSFTTAELSGGIHTITVKATDLAGRESSYSGVRTVVIDAAAPAAPVISGFSDDTLPAGDGYTNDTTPTLSGTAEGSSIVEIFANGVSLGTVTADPSGNWSFTTEALAEASYSFTARATDSAGNESSESAALDIVIGSAPPPATPAPVIVSFANDSGVTGDGVTNDNQIVISGTAVANATIEIFEGASSLGTVTANGAGNWSFTTLVLADGTYEFSAVATAPGGYPPSDPSAVLEVTIDTSLPSVPVITGMSEDTGSSSSDNYTSDNTPTFTGTAEANATVRVYSGGALLGQVAADGAGAWSFTAGTLIDGYHYITARQVDPAGNQSATSATRVVRIDTEAPNVAISAPIASDNVVNGSEDNYFNVSGTVTAGSSAVRVTFTDSLGGTVSGNAVVNGGSWMLSGANISGLANGEITVSAYALDGAGNQSTTATRTITLDNVAPAVPVITGFTEDTGIPNGQTSDTTPTLTGTAGAGEQVRIYFQGSQVAVTTADGDGNWSATTSTLPEGYHYLTARAVDTAGNQSGESNIQVVWVDTTPPAAPSISAWGSDTGTVGDGVTDDNTITLWGTRPAATLVNIYDNGTLIGTVPNTGTSWSFTTSVLPDGEHSFTVVAIDGAGNESVPSTALDITIGEPAPANAFADTIGAASFGWTVFEANGHAYKVVGANNYWTGARDDAADAAPGESYLLTITSAEENAFATTLYSGRLWLGATDLALDGTWVWNAGPEAGTAFWIGDSSGSAVDGAYTNWAAGQPSVVDGYGFDEDYLIRNSAAEWNDSGSYDIMSSARVIAETGGDGQYYGGATEDAPYTFAASVLLQNDAAGAAIASVSSTSSMGATVSYNSGAGEITYDATAAAAVQALNEGETASDTFSYTLADGSTAEVTIEVQGTAELTAAEDYLYVGPFISNSAYDTDTGHFYFRSGYNLTFDQALANIENLDFSGYELPEGITPYLATITSQEENDFVDTVGGSGSYRYRYIGASDADNDGVWQWIGGPEAGQTIWNGGSGGSAPGGAYENWASGEPTTEPGENYAYIDFFDGAWRSAQANDPTMISALYEIGGNGAHFGRYTEDDIITFDESWLTGNDGPGASLASVQSVSLLGATVSYDAGTGTVTYTAQDSQTLGTLSSGATGTDSFLYTLDDGRVGRMNIEVEGVSGFVADAGTSGDDNFYFFMEGTESRIDSVIGGEGHDTLTLSAINSYKYLFLQYSGANALQSVEEIHLDSNYANVRLEAKDVLAMSDDIVGLPGNEKTRLTISGDAGSLDALDDGWSYVGSESADGNTYNIFENGDAQLYVQDTVSSITLPAVA